MRTDPPETGPELDQLTSYLDLQRETITVLRLAGGGYVEHGIFGRGSQAASALLEGFAVDVSAAFDAD